jgi:hypothetical protein
MNFLQQLPGETGKENTGKKKYNPGRQKNGYFRAGSFRSDPALYLFR